MGAAALRLGIAIDPSYRNSQGKAGADFQGVAVTYAQVAAHPALHRARTESRRTLVIFDEVHHAATRCPGARRCGRRSSPPGGGWR